MRGIISSPYFVPSWKSLLQHIFLRTISLIANKVENVSTKKEVTRPYLSEVARYESTCNGVLVAVVCLFSTRLNNMNIDIGII
mgnify:CR=1 FL=1